MMTPAQSLAEIARLLTAALSDDLDPRDARGLAFIVPPAVIGVLAGAATFALLNWS